MEIKEGNINDVDCILESKYVFLGAHDDDECHNDYAKEEEYDPYTQCDKEAGALKTKACQYHHKEGLMKCQISIPQTMRQLEADCK